MSKKTLTFVIVTKVGKIKKKLEVNLSRFVVMDYRTI